MSQAKSAAASSAAPASAPASSAVSNSANDVKGEPQQEVRVLVENPQVGAIIGKSGANVKRIREETGAGLSILKTEANAKQVKERVMVLKGQTAQIAKALHLVAERMVESAAERKEKKDEKDIKDDKSITLRLLVHRYAVGAIIGKAGQVIKETQQETNTRVQVSNDPLPQSTEKTVSVSGSPANVYQAVSRLLVQLRDNQPSKPQRVTHYVPGQQLMVTPMYAGFSPYQAQLMYQAQSQYGQQPTSRQELAIPTNTAGGIIGKGGAVIRDIRMQSGTQISIADPDNANPNERVVSIQGSPQGIATAIYLIRQLVEQYNAQQ